VWLVIAAADVAPGDQSPIIVALISALGGVLVAVIGGLISVARRESADRQHQAAPPSLGERTAVLERRAEDNDERDDMQDHRLEYIERALDRNHPDWRPRA
jgi:hypothetical protein